MYLSHSTTLLDFDRNEIANDDDFNEIIDTNCLLLAVAVLFAAFESEITLATHLKSNRINEELMSFLREKNK